VSRARIAVGAALALSLAFCGAGAWTYAQARGDDSLAYGRERDEALADGRERLSVLHTLDASSREHAQEGIRAWRTAATGPLRAELGRTKPEKGASARGTVTEVALTALDTRAGTAKLIATVRVEVTPAGAARASTDRKRLEAVLARTGPGEWKVKALSAVPLARTAEEDDGR
jgi:Mce-associated membrane protein